MCFSPDVKIALHDGSTVTAGELLRRTVSGDIELTLFSPLASGEPAGVVGSEERDAVTHHFKSGRKVTCATDARLVLAGGPGWCSQEDSAGAFPVLTPDGPDEITYSERVGKMLLVGIRGSRVHAVLADGVWFLTD